MTERPKITRDMTITKAMELNPFAEEIFLDVGLGCTGCAFSEVETIEQGLAGHGFNDEAIELVIEELNRD